MSAWDVCRGNLVRQTRLHRAGRLPRLHAPDPSRFCRKCRRKFGFAERGARRTCRGNSCVHRGRRTGDQPEPRPDAVIAACKACASASARSRRPAGRPHRGCGGQSGRRRRHNHHGSSMGRSGRRLRSQRQTAQRIQSWPFHRAAGLLAPGEQVTSLGNEGEPLTLGGTSAAAPFVTGAIALIWSLSPAASGADVRLAILRAHARARTSDASFVECLGGLPSAARDSSEEVIHA